MSAVPEMKGDGSNLSEQLVDKERLGLEDKEHMRHAHMARTIGNLTDFWDGKQVWALIDRQEGMWRQATIIATVPDKDDPNAPWAFVLDTKHDNWRHILTTTRLDESNLEFDYLQITEYVNLPGHEPTDLRYTHFELLPPESPIMDIKDGECAIHPWVAEELRSLRRLVDQLRIENDQLRRQLQAALEEIEVRKRNEIRLENLWKMEEERRKIAEERLEAALKEIDRLTKENKELKDQVIKLTDQVEFLTHELIKARDRIVILEKENAEIKEVCRVLTKRNQELEEDNKLLRDRIIALDEALQKTIIASNEQIKKLTMEHAVIVAAKDAEIERLLALLASLKDGGPVDDQSALIAQLREEKAQMAKLMEDSIREIKELRYRISLFINFNLDELKLELGRLTVRVVKLEAQRDIIVKPYEPMDDYINPDDNDPDLKQREKEERKIVRDRVRLAIRLAEEIVYLRRRIEELEKWHAVPVEVEVGKTMPNTDGICGLYTIIKRSELNSLRLSNGFLQAENAKLAERLSGPPHTSNEIRYLQETVNLLKGRLEELLLICPHQNNRPIYIPTYTRIWRNIFGHPYSGNYPWLKTAQYHDLERENKELKERIFLAKEEHGMNDDKIVEITTPVLQENAELRERLKQYKDQLDALEKVNAKKPNAGTSSTSSGGGMLGLGLGF